MKNHTYTLSLNWIGKTDSYTSYTRNHIISIPGKEDILCSSDTAFRGDKTRYNPEEMLLASLASCHMLWYLHLCVDEGIIVLEYTDNPEGLLEINETGSGKFTQVVLSPTVIVAEPGMIEKAQNLHRKANQMCFIANSCNFPVRHNSLCSAKL